MIPARWGSDSRTKQVDARKLPAAALPLLLPKQQRQREQLRRPEPSAPPRHSGTRRPTVRAGKVRSKQTDRARLPADLTSSIPALCSRAFRF
ncbi:hypothetical protein VULLAG_LOCUS8807 [Vulpes lagopus]